MSQNLVALAKRVIELFIKPRSLSRFLVVGLINTAVGVLLFPILYHFFSELVSFNVLLAISYVLCTLSSFLLHKFVTFKSQGNAWREGGKFALLSGVTYLLNLLALKLLLPVLPWHPVLVQTVIAVMLQAGNYFGMNRLVFVSLTSIPLLKKWFSRNANH